MTNVQADTAPAERDEADEPPFQPASGMIFSSFFLSASNQSKRFQQVIQVNQ